MKIFFLCFILCSFVNAHFDLEKYAKLYRDKRAQYMEAKKCLIMAEGPYVASRNAFIASTSILANLPYLPHNDTLPINDTGLLRRRLNLRHAQDSNGYPPGDSADSDSGDSDSGDGDSSNDDSDNGDSGGDSGTDNFGEGNATEALSSAEQQEQIYNDYIQARDYWLDCKHKVSMIETPYLAAREAYIVAANSYTNSLLPTAADHLWAPVFTEDTGHLWEPVFHHHH